MLEWWDGLGLIGQILAFIAIPSTVVLVLQTVMLAVSCFGDNADVDSAEVDGVDDLDEIASFDAGGVQIFTIRGFITFFCIFGWSGIWLLSTPLPAALSLIIALILGLGAMIGSAYIVKFFMKLQHSGNLSIKDAPGSSGTVYVNIPKSRLGAGKVTAIVSGRYAEFDAVTDDKEDILTGTQVIIVSVTEPNILIVTKK